MSAHENLNGGQFRQLARKMNTFKLDPETGQLGDAGFSARPHQDEQGRIIKASDSFMVGGMAPEGVTGRPPQASEIAAYAEANHRVLSAHPDHYLGGWNPIDSSVSQPVLDVSRAYSRTFGGMVNAHERAELNNQLAVGEVDEEGEFVRTHSVIPNARAEGEKFLSGLSEDEM